MENDDEYHNSQSKITFIKRDRVPAQTRMVGQSLTLAGFEPRTPELSSQVSRLSHSVIPYDPGKSKKALLKA